MILGVAFLMHQMSLHDYVILGVAFLLHQMSLHDIVILEVTLLMHQMSLHGYKAAADGCMVIYATFPYFTSSVEYIAIQSQTLHCITEYTRTGVISVQIVP